MKKTLTLVLFSSFCFNSHAQNLVKGLVADSAKVPVPYCALALFNAADSSLVKGNISDSLGNYRFEKIKPGNYFIKFNCSGFKAAASSVFTLDSLSKLELPAQFLSSEGINLKEVAVSVFKPAIEFKKGMVVMNVENDLLAKGNTVLELLKRIPGVIVDAQNNITINGVGGVRFLIDDRMQQMPAPQVVDMLSGMNADAVSRIELIKNPPARYDASGTGGLINIVTKKAQMKGFSGNASFGISQGKRIRFGPSLSLNYKAKNLSVFTNFSYGNWYGLTVGQLDRRLERDGKTESINSLGDSESYQHVFFGNAGIELDITKKTLIGFYINGSRRDETYDLQAQTQVDNSTSFNYDKMNYKALESYNIITPNYNLSLVHKLDTLGGQLKLSSGYNTYFENFDKNVESRFYNRSDLEIAPMSRYSNYSDRDFKVYTQKLDLNKTLSRKYALEAGLKHNYVDNYNNNQLNFSNRSTGLFLGDTVFYNGYQYKESVMAGYATVSKSWDKIGFSLGLRAEQTDLNANDLVTQYVFKRSYFNLFPSGSVDLTLNKKNTLTAAYSYRIDRPHYGMLNPVRMFNEQLNYGVGNPELRPQYTHNITFDHNYNQFITQSVGLNKTKDFTFWYSYTPANSKVSIDTISNIAVRDNYYYSLSAQHRIKWYGFQTYAVLMYRSLEGNLLGQNVNSKTVQLYVNLNQEFFLPKDFKVQIWAGRGSGFQDGPQFYYPRSAVHVSFSKSLMDKKLTLTLSVHDIFYKDYQGYTNQFPDQYLYWIDKSDSRRIRFTLNYRFGKMRIEQRIRTETDNRMQTGK